MELREYFNLIVKNWWIIAALFLVTLAAGLTLSYSETPLYEADSSFFISPNRSAGGSAEIPYLISEVGRSYVPITYCNILTSSSTYQAAADTLDLNTNSLGDYETVCNHLADSNILIFQVIGPNPRLASDLNTAIGDAAIAFISSSPSYQVFELLWLDRPPSSPDEPISPNHARNLVLTGALGAVLGIAVVLLKEYLQAPLSRIQNLSIIDPETGMYNQRYLIQRLEQEINRSRTRLRPLSMAFLEVTAVEELELYPEVIQERFKRQLNLFLPKQIREVDLLGHVEGNRYAIILPETPGDEAQEILTRLIQQLREETFTLEDLKVSANYVGVAGIVETSGGNLDRRTMISRAEKALLEAVEEDQGEAKLVRATPRPFLGEGEMALESEAAPAGTGPFTESLPFTDTSFTDSSAFSGGSEASPFTETSPFGSDVSPFDDDYDLG